MRYSIYTALTIENVVKYTRPLTGKQLGECLSVQESYYDKMSKKYPTQDELIQIALVAFWLQKDPLASWRRLIEDLYKYNHLEIADKIRHYAKEPSGMCMH